MTSSQDAEEQKQLLRDEIDVLRGEKKFLEETVQAQHVSIPAPRDGRAAVFTWSISVCPG